MLTLVLKPHRTYLKSGTADPQKVFAMLKLLPKGEVAHSRPLQAFALVIDTSGSMREFADQEQANDLIQSRGLRGAQTASDGSAYQSFNLSLPTKLDQAIQAAHTFVDDPRLKSDDKVTLIHFDDKARTLLPLTPLSDKQAIHQALESLRQFSGGTRMGKGLSCAHEELSRLSSDFTKRVLLLTDGATSEENNCRSVARQFAAVNVPIAAIGVGVEYNEDLLRELAEVTQGRPYPLNTTAQLGPILDGEIHSSVREVVTDVRVAVVPVKGVAMNGMTRVYPNLAAVEMAQSPYRLGNVAAGDYTVFMLEFTVAGVARSPGRARLAQVKLSGNVPVLGRREEFPPQDLIVNFSQNELQLTEMDAEVVGYVQQKNIDHMMQEAVRLVTTDVKRAQSTLEAAAGMTERLNNAAMTQLLNEALSELSRTGGISSATRKTVALAGRTRTVKTAAASAGSAAESVLSTEEIRKATGL